MRQIYKGFLENGKIIISALAILAFLVVLYAGLSAFFSYKYEAGGKIIGSDLDDPFSIPKKVFVATHIETPDPLKAMYMTSWVAGTPTLRKHIIDMIRDTELNAVVIDIKDDTGRVSFKVEDPALVGIGSEEVRIADLRDFILELHKENIYVIGRISSFQDPYMVKLHNDWAVKRASDGVAWKDRKGLSWIDPGAREMWDYLALVGKESFNAGFDELNYDYIRFPSDGNMQDIAYPYSEDKNKSEVMNEYYKYLTTKLREHKSATGVVPVISADLFGMTTVAINNFDMNIGQVLVDALSHFDYVAPMVYPSHYPPYFEGYLDPNKVPYEIVKISMDGAVLRASNLAYSASTTPEVYINKIRPWLQDFDYGGNYDVAEIRAQIKAVYDAGLTSWMVWDASNRYTPSAYNGEDGLPR